MHALVTLLRDTAGGGIDALLKGSFSSEASLCAQDCNVRRKIGLIQGLEAKRKVPNPKRERERSLANPNRPTECNPA